jgi:hypothetical protein
MGCSSFGAVDRHLLMRWPGKLKSRKKQTCMQVVEVDLKTAYFLRTVVGRGKNAENCSSLSLSTVKEGLQAGRERGRPLKRGIR